MSRNRGNRKAQARRRKNMIREVEWQPDEYELIDGNISHFPVAYCKRKQGFLTMGLVNTHRCDKRNCNMFERWDF